MEIISSTSFLHLLGEISEAISQRNESKTHHEALLRRIFSKQTFMDLETDDYDSISQISRVYRHLRLKLLPLPKEEKVFGRIEETSYLLRKCCNLDVRIQLSAIPILGAAGIGKTALARLIYEDKSVLKHFKVRVWVKFDGKELSLHHAAQQILKSAMGMPCSIDDLYELDEMVRDALQWQRCLIVFDGVGSMARDVWLHMNECWFNFVDVGCTVLITTPSDDVASLVASEPFELKHLPRYEILPLYQYISFDSSDDVERSREITRNLEALCGYNPLLLKLVGSMLRFHDKLRTLLSQTDFSEGISQLPFDASAVILLCIWALPPQLRQCLAFCAVFPKDYVLQRMKIIDMWVAHGLVKPSPETNLHDVGNSYFRQLLCRSFFTEIARNEYGDISDFQMHSLIHTIMQDVASIVLIGKIGVIASISEDARHLSLHTKFAGEHIRQDVSTLILSSTLYSGRRSSLDHWLLDFQVLQSLDLSCSGIQNLSNDICALRLLAYLNLSYTLVEALPDSIRDLSRLQTLDLSWCCRFKVLTEEICNLTYMRHLDFSQCVSLSHLPSGIGLLTSLTSMPLFVLGNDRDSARLGELGQLNQLRGRLDIRNLENVMEISDARDAKLNQKKLHHLVLSWSKDASNSFEVLELLEPNRQLKVLDITGYMGSSFPRWISSMSSLVKMSITVCGCKKLPSLGQLLNLKELQLKGMASIQYIGPEFYGNRVAEAFPSLEQLGHYDVPTLEKRRTDLLKGMVSSQSIGSEFYENRGPTLNSLPTARIQSFGHEFYRNRVAEAFPFLEQLGHYDVPTLEKRRTDLLRGMVSSQSIGSEFYGNRGLYDVPSLKNLPTASIQSIGPEFYGNRVAEAFPSLEQLGLYDMPTLEEWSTGNNFPLRRLKTLTVEGCPQLQNIPSFRNLPELIVCNSNDAILTSLDQTRFDSLSSLLIKNMGFFKNPSRWPSLKKLILFNITDHSKVLYLETKGFTGLEHFCIAHCPKVREITLSDTSSIQSLYVVDCPNLERINFSTGAANLTELLIDACPELYYLNTISSLSSLTKLIIRGISGGDQFRWDGDFKELEKLQYLSICESPQLERKLEMEPSLISHIPCVLLGNRKRSSGT